MTFIDVRTTDYFYEAVHYLYCAAIISGYGDNTFRPYNNTTRGQLCKIVVLAEGWPLYTPPSPTFSDVSQIHPFYRYVETAYHQSVINGYSDGTFRPGNYVTRGQLCKIVVLAEGWPLYTPPSPTFSDVPEGYPFYQYIETAYQLSIISGYGDRTFRPGDSATRGQIAKIVYTAIQEPSRH
jgi:trimeric autotransporter adhesin